MKLEVPYPQARSSFTLSIEGTTVFLRLMSAYVQHLDVTCRSTLTLSTRIFYIRCWTGTEPTSITPRYDSIGLRSVWPICSSEQPPLRTLTKFLVVNTGVLVGSTSVLFWYLCHRFSREFRNVSKSKSIVFRRFCVILLNLFQTSKNCWT
jgi:hypothetical protein